MFKLIAKNRDANENLAEMRKGTELPAVFYGLGKDTISISVSKVEFKKVWQKAGESSTVVLSTPSGDVDVLIHEVQTHPITDEPIHVDFLVVDKNKKIKVSIPLVFEGVSPAVKGGSGTLVKVLHEVEVEALPKDLPHDLVVDISKLAELHSQVLVSDISLPSGVTMVTKNNEVVASIAEQKEEKETTNEPIDLSKIEVEKKGKKEEEAPATE
ncbi:50S ribosomal protein L25 [Candidatus Nomurabacteria bacterium]|nr:50S ribosomal protein L25 [Candidatus Nomurabacteria bacterium]